MSTNIMLRYVSSMILELYVEYGTITIEAPTACLGVAGLRHCRSQPGLEEAADLGRPRIVPSSRMKPYLELPKLPIW